MPLAFMRKALEGAAPPPDIKLLWPNTIALALSSAAIHWSLICLRRKGKRFERSSVLSVRFVPLRS